jgi:hypothetical protein
VVGPGLVGVDAAEHLVPSCSIHHDVLPCRCWDLTLIRKSYEPRKGSGPVCAHVGGFGPGGEWGGGGVRGAYWHTPVGHCRAEQSAQSRAEQPARRIPAGSGGCLTSRGPVSQEIKREHALSNKQVHTTHQEAR